MENNNSAPGASSSNSRLTERQRHVLIGSSVVFFVSLGVLIPAFGLLFGWIFTLGGGLLGGAAIGYLRKSGGRDGAKYGLVVGLIGGIPSSLIGVIGGSILNAALISSSSGGDSGTAGSLLIFAIIGLISGLFLKVLGGFVGGGLVGWFLDENA
ncbi:DUF5518 domain-containing protein [Haloferax prahovense]|nr:DUF5518 domain-containing protein [Haloferax prahovense]